MKFSSLVALTLFLMTHLPLPAQDNTCTAGGTSTGSGGSSTYTIGQAAYSTNFGINGSLAEGVQQPHEISVIVGLNDAYYNLKLGTFPNPVFETLTLHAHPLNYSGLSYRLMNMSGANLLSGLIVEEMTTIDLSHFASSIYILSILKDNFQLRTFQIIKY